MIKLGIIGFPLGHTLSPIMHKAALNHLGLEGDYLALETPPDELNAKIEHLKNSGFNGFNVTIPFKVDVIPLLDSIDSNANIIGAVNTVFINGDNKLSGFNTDVYGFVNAMPAEIQQNIKNSKAVVLGTGGASRAIVTGLANLGVSEIDLIARNPAKAEDLKTLINQNFPSVKTEIYQLTENINLSNSYIVVNTTPLGMEGINENLSPLTIESLKTLPQNAVVYDIVYKPKTTKLIQLAKELNLTTIEGLEMLILQGAKAFEIWTGQKAPVDVMRETAAKALGYE